MLALTASSIMNVVKTRNEPQQHIQHISPKWIILLAWNKQWKKICRLWLVNASVKFDQKFRKSFLLSNILFILGVSNQRCQPSSCIYLTNWCCEHGVSVQPLHLISYPKSARCRPRRSHDRTREGKCCLPVSKETRRERGPEDTRFPARLDRVTAPALSPSIADVPQFDLSLLTQHVLTCSYSVNTEG